MRQPADWVLDLVCCGRDDGHQGCPTWEAADEFRESYTSGAGVDPHGCSGSGFQRHVRAAILRQASPGEPIGFFEAAFAARGERP